MQILSMHLSLKFTKVMPFKIVMACDMMFC